MNRPTLIFLTLTSAAAAAETTSYVNFVRQTQQVTNVVWQMPVSATGASPAALAIEPNGSLFQLWTINQTKNLDFLLDQKTVGAYMPAADVKAITLDPAGKVPRTRVDQPFSVEIKVSGLLSGADFPLASSRVLLQQNILSYAPGETSLGPAKVLATSPIYSGYISSNGTTVLKFPASSLKATDPTKATGEEYFVVHALADGTISQSQIASGFVQVWPVASGAIKGISNGDTLRFQSPKIELTLTDLYPRSDTSFMLYKGSSVNGNTGTLVKAYPLDRETPASAVITVTELDAALRKDGTYTLGLISQTVYGTELLAPPVTFQVKRTLQVNAMQVTFSGDQNP